MDQQILFIIAMVAIMSLLGVAVLGALLTSQEASARGCNNSIAFNASKGRCLILVT
jgi:Tfp pilus assembly protein PilX